MRRSINGWQRLVLEHDVRGIEVHNARLVAAMKMHGITHLLTLNFCDFLRYAHITVVHPLSVA
jgi:hypothetical protein